jgi:tetratricopeptide (TPR) repeat protein
MATRLGELQAADDWRRIAALEREALALARDVRGVDPGMAGAIHSTLGNAYNSLGDFSKAIEYHTQHLAIANEVGDWAGEGGANGNLGCAYHSQGDFSQAIAHHTQNLAIAKEVGDRAEEGRPYGGLGNAHHALGDFPRRLRTTRSAWRLPSRWATGRGRARRTRPGGGGQGVREPRVRVPGDQVPHAAPRDCQ